MEHRTFLTVFEKWVYLKAIVFSFVMVGLIFAAYKLGEATGVPGFITLPAIRIVEILFMVYLLKQANVLAMFNSWTFSLRKLWVVLAMLIPIAGGIAIHGLDNSIDSNPIYYLLRMQTVGLAEEIQFRAVIFLVLTYAFLKQQHPSPAMKSILVVAGLFGVMHLVNLTQGGDVLPILTMVVSAFIVTFSFCIIVVITRNIWVVGFLHGLHNSTTTLSILEWTGFGPVINETLIVVAIGAIVLMFFKSDDLTDFVNDLKARTIS